jgi:hypothetical protein
MKIAWKSFALGFGLSTIACAGFTVWLLREIDQVSQRWVLPRASFTDMGDAYPGAGYVHFTGSIGGRESMAYPYNLFQGRCFQDEGVCRTESVQKIGPNQLSDIDTTTFKIAKWTPDIIVAESGEDSPMCVTITLNIRRAAKTVEYIRSPKSPLPNSEMCKAIKLSTRVWEITEPPGTGS